MNTPTTTAQTKLHRYHINFAVAHAQRLADALKAAQKFIAKLEKLYVPNVIEPNSNSGLDWDIRFTIREALADWSKAQ